MRAFLITLLLFATAAAAQPAVAPGPIHALDNEIMATWQPTAPYVVIGQDEPGYRNWYLAAPIHAGYVRSFNDYLVASGVGGVVPTWQLLRTASDWYKCGAPAFEIPPTNEWPNIVQTLRYVRDKVIPTIGPVEPVSVYRNASLNQCAGGARESAHRFTQAVDLVPLRPTSREALIRSLCTVHASDGERYGVGLGFYPFLRFHIDSRRFRNWGHGGSPEAAECIRPAVTTVPLPPATTQTISHRPSESAVPANAKTPADERPKL